MENYLIHYRTGGEKKGVRRYQHEDGTYTEEGLERKRAATGYKGVRNKLKSAFSNKSLNKASNRVGQLDNINDQSKGILGRVSNIKNRFSTPDYPDLSNMTDQDLRNYVNRYNLEQNYLRAIGAGNNVSRGEQITQEVLDTAGDVLAVTGSALAIALSIKALKGGKE